MLAKGLKEGTVSMVKHPGGQLDSILPVHNKDSQLFLGRDVLPTSVDLSDQCRLARLEDELAIGSRDSTLLQLSQLSSVSDTQHAPS